MRHVFIAGPIDFTFPDWVIFVYFGIIIILYTLAVLAGSALMALTANYIVKKFSYLTYDHRILFQQMFLFNFVCIFITIIPINNLVEKFLISNGVVTAEQQLYTNLGTSLVLLTIIGICAWLFAQRRYPLILKQRQRASHMNV